MYLGTYIVSNKGYSVSIELKLYKRVFVTLVISHPPG